jgi:Ca2+-transporting ATPase
MQNAQRKSEMNAQEILYKRIRIFIRPVYRNEAAAARLAGYISTLNGVAVSKANPLTGKLLVLFDEDVIDETAIRNQIYSYVSGCAFAEKSNLIELDSMRSRENGGATAGACAGSVTGSGTAETNPAAKSELEEPGRRQGSAGRKSRICTAESSFPAADGRFCTAGNGFPAAVRQFHTMEPDEIEKILNTSLEYGLPDQHARGLISRIGSNVLSEKKRKSILAKIIGNLTDFSTRLLLGVGAVSLFIGQIADAAAIFGIALLETVMGAVQQHRAERSVFSLKSMMVHRTRVIRDGKAQTIASKYLVPGDVILLESGDKVPADARIVECFELRATEAMLTGESTPVSKSSGICGGGTELAGRHNMLFMGTSVLCGRAKAVVTATGMNTEVGKIADMLNSIREEQAPVKIRINRLTNRIAKAAMLFCLLMIGAGLLSGRALADVLIMSICFAIGAIPESLPAVVNASMALSVQRMANKNAIVRSLPAVETLGSADVICCDKTGTLTMNEMTVRRIYVSGAFYGATGSGYNPSGTIRLLKGGVGDAGATSGTGKTVSAGTGTGAGGSRDALRDLLKAGVLCSNARLINDAGKWSVQGDPTEGALLTAAYKVGLDAVEIESSCKRIREIPFDSARLCMTVEALDSGTRISYCKGAFSRIAEKCSLIYENGRERLFTAADRERIQAYCNEMGDDALRVLAFACKQLGDGRDSLDSNYVFLGLVGMEDPVREEARESIKKCRRAGIRVVMITGDNKNTAAAVGRQLGLFTGGRIVTGAELDIMTSEELRAGIDQIQIFARTCPEQKHRIIKALKYAGHTVAMIGDGVNDAPAMKEANIGIAMGRNGSDVAKDVAAITLVDDNLSTVIDAIQEGRSVSDNIKNSVKYLLAGALGEIGAVILAALAFGVSPLLSIQMLWINVISETIMGSTLAVEPSSAAAMNRPPDAAGRPLLDKQLVRQIWRRGALIGLTTFGIFALAMIGGLGPVKARTLAFAALIFSQLVNVYSCRSDKKKRPSTYMNVAALTSSALLLGIIYFPPLGGFFKTAPLNPADAAALCASTGLSAFGQ